MLKDMDRAAITGIAKYLAIALLVAAYPLTSHYWLASPAHHAVAATLWILVPLCLLLLWACHSWLKQQRLFKGALLWPCLLAAAALLSLALMQAWPWLMKNRTTLYVIEHVGTNLLLAWLFAHTLLQGRVALITSLATAIHGGGQLPERIRRYTRSVTLAWAAFFCLISLISLILFFSTDLSHWSLFANILSWPLVALMFAGEYAVRRYRHSDYSQASFGQSILAISSHWNAPGRAQPVARNNSVTEGQRT